MAIRILLVDDHLAYRQTLRAVLDQTPGLHVVAEAADGEAALRHARALIPDLVLIDVMMPGMNGLEATRRLIAAVPSVRVLALSMHTEAPFVEGMFEAGAGGYAVKDSEAAELVQAVHVVAGGDMYLSPGLDGHADPPGDEGS